MKVFYTDQKDEVKGNEGNYGEGKDEQAVEDTTDVERDVGKDEEILEDNALCDDDTNPSSVRASALYSHST